MARPSTEIIDKYNVIEQFQRYSSPLLLQSIVIQMFYLFDSSLTLRLTVKCRLNCFLSFHFKCCLMSVLHCLVVPCLLGSSLLTWTCCWFRCGLKTVINLQRPGEHASCGNSLEQESGFTYRPETFMEAGSESPRISYICSETPQQQGTQH